MRRLVAAVAFALVGIGNSAPAQQGGPRAERIAYGETATNSLTTDNDTLADGSAYQPYYFDGSAGDSITLVMASRHFNAHLILTDSADNVLNSDANSAGQCDAQLTHVLPDDGFYLIYATAGTRAELGQFQLTLMQGAYPPPSREPCRGFVGPEGIVQLGDEVSGALTDDDRVLADSSYFEIWTFPEPGGGPFTADLVSEEFDGSLILVRGFDQVAAVNDDGGSGCNARIVHTPTDETPLRLVVVARPAHRTGTYTLRVTEGDKLVLDDDPCTPPGAGPDGGV